MSEVSTELPDSVLPLATERAARLGRALGHVSKAVQIELADIAFEPDKVDEATRAELAEFGQQLLEFMHQGHSLLKDIVESGAVTVVENGGGLPLRIEAYGQPLELETSTKGHHEIVIEPQVSEEEGEPTEPVEPVQPASQTEKTAQRTLKGTKPEKPETELPGVAVELNGTVLEGKELGLTHAHEVEVLRALTELGGRPLTRRWMLDRGFYEDAGSESARFQAFQKAVVSLVEKLEAVARETVLEKTGTKGGTRYVVKSPFKVDGVEIIPTDLSAAVQQVKKKKQLLK